MKIMDKYSIKEHFPYGWVVLFDEDAILMWSLRHSDAERTCAMLNGAYKYGYLSGMKHAGEIMEDTLMEYS